MKKVNLKDNMMALAVTYIVAGILFIIFKQEVLKWLCAGFGIVLIVLGIIDLIQASQIGDPNVKNNALTASIIAIVFGILLFAFAWLFILIITIIVAILFMISGILKISECFAKKMDVAKIIVAIMYIAVGVLLLIDNGIVYIILGSLLIFAGILDLIDSTIINKEEKVVRIKVDENVIDMKE